MNHRLEQIKKKFPNYGWEEAPNGDIYSVLVVMQSAAGHYIGRYFAEWIGGSPCPMPGTRESEYYPTEELAQKALDEGFEERDCAENEFAKAEGLIPG